MISIDEAAKLLLVVTICICLVLFTVYLVRLIHQASEAIKDSRSVIRNVSHISDQVDRDFTSVRSKVRDLGQSVNVVNAFLGILGATGLLSKFKKNNQSREDSKKSTAN